MHIYIYLLEGDIAEKNQLEKLSDRSTTLTVVGGGSVDTKFGVYRFFLGPTPDNEYKEIICQGIPHVTGFFSKMDLSIVNSE